MKFERDSVAPSSVKILTDLSAQHDAQATTAALRERASRQWHTDDIEGFCNLVFELRKDPLVAHPSVKAVIRQHTRSGETRPLFEDLAETHETFLELDRALQFLLAEHRQFNLQELGTTLEQLRKQTGILTELLPVLGEIMDLPRIIQPRAAARRSAPRSMGRRGRSQEPGLGLSPGSCRRPLRQPPARERMEQLDKDYREWLAQNSRCIRAAVRRKFLDHVSVSSMPASQLDAEQKAFKKLYAAGRRELEHEFGKTIRFKSIRDLAANGTGAVVRDLKPIWLMSPLSVSDTLPLDPSAFDVVIFDEASQIPLEEAIPALYRSHQVIVVGDEMQLPPTRFFTTARGDDDTIFVEEEGERIEVDLGSESFLTQSATNLPSTLLAWHYRSRYESLISFSNAAFYSGNLFTIPDLKRSTPDQAEPGFAGEEHWDACVDAILGRSISFHFIENGVYENRRNQAEAAHIAQLVGGLLARKTGSSIGVVAFSEAQQGEIEDALSQLALEDSAFAARLEAEYVREENDQYCGLFVKNLENVQGDERDIIIMSVCYARDLTGRMLMNFGPINQRGGEKRLNVIFSRAGITWSSSARSATTRSPTTTTTAQTHSRTSCNIPRPFQREIRPRHVACSRN